MMMMMTTTTTTTTTKNNNKSGSGAKNTGLIPSTILESVAISSVVQSAGAGGAEDNSTLEDHQQKIVAIEHYKQELEKEDSHFISRVDKMLEKERFENKSEKWNRLDNSIRIEKLHEFADSYFESLFLDQYRRAAAAAAETDDAALIVDGTQRLKLFFDESLKKKRLVKVKEIAYNRELGTIEQIPSLQFHEDHNFFFLKNNTTVDGGHISTTKSLTPKRA